MKNKVKLSLEKLLIDDEVNLWFYTEEIEVKLEKCLQCLSL